MGACVHCGRELPPQGKFCPSCGKPRAEKAAPSAPPVMAPSGNVMASQPPMPAAPAARAAAGKPSGWLALMPSLSRWDVFALVGGVISAAIWYGWSAMDVKDTTTPKYILLLPIIIVLFRKPIDLLLTPLHAVKKHVPRLLLIAIGLAVPYLVTHYFYKRGVSNFPLAQKSIVWGTILSYVILRIPDTSLLSRVSLPKLPVGLLLWGALWFGSLVALADDFGRDKRRLEDGMRTPGWAETIAGTAATVISVLVNGALVFQSSSGTRKPGEDQSRYTMDVKTENARTSLVTDDTDRLWVYGQLTCVKGGVTTDLTGSITFSLTGEYTDWVSVRQTGYQGRYKAILLGAKKPRDDAELKEGAKVTVMVSGRTADGEPIDAPVTIDLEGELELKVTVLA